MVRLIMDPELWLGIIGVLVTFWLVLGFNRLYGRTREKHFRLLLENSPFPIILKDKNGTIIYVSHSLNPLLGYRPGQLLGRHLSELVIPADKTKYQRLNRQLPSPSGRRQTAELRFKHKNGHVLWLNYVTVNLLRLRQVRAVMVSFKDISQRKKLDEQKQKMFERERKARSVAEEAVRSRDQFLSVASHELRTPLTTILLQLQSTLRRILTQSLADFSGEKLVLSLSIAEQQSQRLSLLIKDLLNVSLITSGRLEINKEAADLDKIARGVLTGLKEQIQLSGSRIKFSGDGPIPGRWDTVRLEQCLINLLTNAIKYGRQKSIDLTLTRQESGISVSVKDQGIGIAPADQKRIFKPFQRTNEVGRIKGLGVGLFIARRIAQAHGGDIRVDSRLGKGSTFTLTLPVN